MNEFFLVVLYQPLFNLLIGIYHILPWKDLGLAIIILTLLIKLILFYPSLKAMRAQKALQDVQPKLAELKKKYANDKEELGKQIMSFYKENKVNPLSSCLPVLIQLPILWALFKVFFAGLATDPQTGLIVVDQLNNLYEPLRSIYQTTPINHMFLGFVNLAATKNIPLAVLSGVAQFLQAKMLSTKKAAVQTPASKDEALAASMNKQMLYFFPIITIIFGFQFPAGVTLYWLFSTLFTWVQQLIFLRDRTNNTHTPSASAKKPELPAKSKS
ncbi:MAG TPA: YidC/Oxa1 family membrane protein insertase [Patescibacteria group bacterium]|nr:YidC/Oxa1 family membrane protein insertase [Patescibacteria group bacterium]